MRTGGRLSVVTVSAASGDRCLRRRGATEVMTSCRRDGIRSLLAGYLVALSDATKMRLTQPRSSPKRRSLRGSHRARCGDAATRDEW